MLHIAVGTIKKVWTLVSGLVVSLPPVFTRLVDAEPIQSFRQLQILIYSDFVQAQRKPTTYTSQMIIKPLVLVFAASLALPDGLGTKEEILHRERHRIY